MHKDASTKKALYSSSSKESGTESGTASGTVSDPIAAKAIAAVAVVGARGYSGAELTRILLKHPEVNQVICLAKEKTFDLFDYLPNLSAEQASKVQVQPMGELNSVLKQVGAVFLATPAEVSLQLAPQILSSGVSVIDLSGAFRLSETEAKLYYQVEGEALNLLAQAEYGLVPWSGPFRAKNQPSLITNPGCYATATLMGVLPLLKDKLIDPASLVIDAKSGATGAGRKAAENLIFSELQEECRPYRVGKHQHLPEIMQYAELYASTCIKPHFVTHLLSVRRGILAGIYCRTQDGVTPEKIQKAYDSAYSGYSLVHTGSYDSGKRGQLSFKNIVGSARTEIRFELNGDQLYVFSMIDNLMKGAASQAVENFNRLRDIPVTTALNSLEGIL